MKEKKRIAEKLEADKKKAAAESEAKRIAYENHLKDKKETAKQHAAHNAKYEAERKKLLELQKADKDQIKVE